MTRLPGMMGLMPALKKTPVVEVSVSQVLMDILTRQHELYQQLSALAAKQSELVRSGDTNTLMSVLGARQNILEQLSPLDQQLQPYRATWDENLSAMTPDNRAKAQKLMAEVQQMLAAILKQDEEDRQSLMAQKEDVGAQIGQTVTGVQLNKAYGVKSRVNR